MIKARRVKLFVVFVLFLMTATLFLSSLVYGQIGGSLEVSYIDVGQGDSIWLHAADGSDVLIDGGPSSAGPTVVAYLQEAGVDDIEVMVLTHGDADHVGGLIDVLQSDIPVESVIYNGQDHDTLTYRRFITETKRLGLTPTPAQAGQTYTWGAINASVLNPQSTLQPDQNENSVVMLAVYGDVRFLFTGDIGSETEQMMLEAVTGTLTLRYQLPADVLKVAHHGSKYSSSAAFLEVVEAEVAVISVGADNPYGHPAPETLDRLEAAGAQVLRTDQDGTIVITTDGTTYEVNVDYLIFLPTVKRRLLPTATWSPSSTPTSTWTPTPTGGTPTPSQTPSSTPTGSPTPTPTPTPTHTSTSTSTPTQESSPAPSGNIDIINIFYDGVKGRQEPDEYVEIRNNDTNPIYLDGWTLRDDANHTFTFPGFLMQPNQTCRIYTNENHPEWCGFSYGSGSAIWNNSGDCAYLRDATNALIDTYCY